MNYRAAYKSYGAKSWRHGLVVYATRDEAEQAARTNRAKWALCNEATVLETSDPVTARWVDGKDVFLTRKERMCLS